MSCLISRTLRLISPLIWSSWIVIWLILAWYYRFWECRLSYWDSCCRKDSHLDLLVSICPDRFPIVLFSLSCSSNSSFLDCIYSRSFQVIYYTWMLFCSRIFTLEKRSSLALSTAFSSSCNYLLRASVAYKFRTRYSRSLDLDFHSSNYTSLVFKLRSYFSCSMADCLALSFSISTIIVFCMSYFISTMLFS